MYKIGMLATMTFFMLAGFAGVGMAGSTHNLLMGGISTFVICVGVYGAYVHLREK